jgi:hypothetical protein
MSLYIATEEFNRQFIEIFEREFHSNNDQMTNPEKEDKVIDSCQVSATPKYANKLIQSNQIMNKLAPLILTESNVKSFDIAMS